MIHSLPHDAACGWPSLFTWQLKSKSGILRWVGRWAIKMFSIVLPPEVNSNFNFNFNLAFRITSTEQNSRG